MVVAFHATISPLRADDPWSDVTQAGPIEIRSEFRISDVDGLTTEAAQLHADVVRVLRLNPSEQGIQLNLFRSKFSYNKYLSIRVPEATSRKAVYIKGPDKGRVYVYRSTSFWTDLRHECTHAILHDSLPYLPLWLDEGLAEYFEVPPAERATKHPHRRSLAFAIPFGWRPQLAQLEEKSELKDFAGSDYRDAWGVTHFLLHGPPEARQLLSNYLAAISAGQAPGRLSERLAVAVPNYEERISDHLRSLP